jgi:hypothetical protein
MENDSPLPNIDELANWAKFTQFAATDFVEPFTRNKEIEKVWQNYDANINRVKAMIATPALCTWLRGKWQLCRDIARLRILGGLDFSDTFGDKEAELNELASHLLTEWGATYTANLQAQKTGDKLKDKLVNNLEGSRILIEELLVPAMLLNNIELRVGFEHIIETSITSAWTAFEVMSEGLWEEAVNLRPVALATLSGKSRYGKKTKPGKGEEIDFEKSGTIQEGGGEKSISLRYLRDLDYDTKGKMGSVLKSKYSFDRLWNIRKAYETAFEIPNI